jgi:hypothetical protein
MLEPVGELAEVVGYRSIQLCDTAEPQVGHGAPHSLVTAPRSR